MKLRRSLFVFLTLILLLGGGFVVAFRDRQAATLTPITVATVKTPLTAPYIIAKEQGFFAKHGLEVNLAYFTTGLEMLHALTENKAEFATPGSTPFAQVSLQRDDLRAINSVLASEDIQLVARKDAGISALADLRGKRIGTVKGTATKQAITDTLAGAGLTPNDFQLVEVNQPLPLPNLLANKELDAYAAWEPFVLNGKKAAGEGNSLVFGEQGGLHTFYYLTVTRASYLTPANERTLESLQKSLLEASDYIQDHRAESIETVSAAIGMEKETLGSIWDKYRQDVSLSRAMRQEIESQKALSKTADSKVDPAVDSLIDLTSLKKVAPRRVEL